MPARCTPTRRRRRPGTPAPREPRPPAVDATYGTSGSAAVAFYARDFQAKNLTFANDYVEVGTSNIQAVALMTQQDKLISRTSACSATRTRCT